MSNEPHHDLDEERFIAAAKSVTDAASALRPPSARDARARQQRHAARVVAVVVLVTCFGIVAAVTSGNRSVGRDLAVGAGPGGTTPGSTTGSTPGTIRGTVPTEVTITTDVAAPPTPSTTTTIDAAPTETTSPPSTSIPTDPTTTAPDETTKPGEPRWVLTYKGTYSGVGHYALFTEACRDMKHDLDLTFVPENGTTWTLHSDFCASIDANNVWSGEGPFTITMPDGSTLTGTLVSKAPLPTSGVPYTLKITGGTGMWTDVDGRCDLTIALHETNFGEQPQDGTFTCELRARVGMP